MTKQGIELARALSDRMSHPGNLLKVLDADTNAKASLTTEQINDQQTKAASGDKIALQALTTEARRGDSFAQLSLGTLYDNGWGVPQAAVNVITFKFNTAPASPAATYDKA